MKDKIRKEKIREERMHNKEKNKDQISSYVEITNKHESCSIVQYFSINREEIY